MCACASGLLFVVFPAQMNDVTYKVDVAGDAKVAGLLQIIGVLTTCLGLFYVGAGRANSAWFLIFTQYERLAACLLFTYVYMTGAISLKQLANSVCVDGCAALITWYLCQQEHV